MKTNEEKKCLLCEQAIKGRADKKFCNDYCRAEYNYSHKSSVNNFIRNTNNALSRNRRILETFLQGKSSVKKINRDRMLHAGFQFKYLTHTYLNRKHEVFYFCYEFGYLPLDNDRYLIVKRKDI